MRHLSIVTIQFLSAFLWLCSRRFLSNTLLKDSQITFFTHFHNRRRCLANERAILTHSTAHHFTSHTSTTNLVKYFPDLAQKTIRWLWHRIIFSWFVDIFFLFCSFFWCDVCVCCDAMSNAMLGVCVDSNVSQPTEIILDVCGNSGENSFNGDDLIFVRKIFVFDFESSTLRPISVRLQFARHSNITDVAKKRFRGACNAISMRLNVNNIWYRYFSPHI